MHNPDKGSEKLVATPIFLYLRKSNNMRPKYHNNNNKPKTQAHTQLTHSYLAGLAPRNTPSHLRSLQELVGRTSHALNAVGATSRPRVVGTSPSSARHVVLLVLSTPRGPPTRAQAH